MSVKVYTGFKVPEKYTKDFDSFNKWMEMVSDESQKYESQQYLYQKADMLCNAILDLYCWEQKVYNKMPGDLHKTLKAYFDKLNRDINEECKSPSDINYLDIIMGIETIMDEEQWEVEKTKYRNPTFDFKPAISLASFENKLYGMVVDEHDLFNHLIEKGYIEDYYYQNQTDPDENVSEAEWNEREKVWNAIDYFTFQVIIDYHYIKYGYLFYNNDLKKLDDCIKDIQDKVKESYIREKIIITLFQDVSDADKETDEEEKKMPHYFSKIYRLIGTAYDEKGNDKELIQKVKEHKEELKKILDNFDICDYIDKHRTN